VAKFRFGLETLLRYREDREQKERDELSHRTKKYQVEFDNCDKLTKKLRATMKELSQKQSENAPHQELDYYYRYLARLNHEISESKKRLAQLQVDVQSQKEAVIEASKKRKTIATMRAKKEQEFVIALDRQEQKEVDDMVVARYARREIRAERE
jgi:flagellar export protein FliJ